MGRRRCCCITCTVFSDDFDPPHSTDLGPGWTEESGDWETALVAARDVLRENGTTGACVLTTAESTTNEQHVNADIVIYDGDVHRVICNAVDDDNYHFVQITQTAINTRVQLFRRADGADSELEDETIDKIETETGVTICINDVSFTVSFSPTPPGAFIYHCNPALFSNGKKAGLGNGGTSAILFDGFTLENFYGRDSMYPGARCCLQQCMCVEDDKDYCIAHDLTVTIVAFGGCAAIDGVTFALRYHPGTGEWRSETDPNGGLPCIEDFWAFNCNGLDSQFDITNQLNDQFVETGGPEECVNYAAEATSVLCDPLVVVFPLMEYDAYDPSIGCVCCDDEVAGGFYVIVS